MEKKILVLMGILCLIGCVKVSRAYDPYDQKAYGYETAESEFSTAGTENNPLCTDDECDEEKKSTNESTDKSRVKKPAKQGYWVLIK